MHNKRHLLIVGLLLLIGLIMAGCEPTAQIIVPTALPTITLTYTPSPTRTPGTSLTSKSERSTVWSLDGRSDIRGVK